MDTIYVLTNPSMPDVVKIGWTARSVRDRVAELNTTGVPESFEVGYCLYVRDGRALEKYLHAHFHAARRTSSREFFAVDVQAVVGTITDWLVFDEVAEDDGLEGAERSEFVGRCMRKAQTIDAHQWYADWMGQFKHSCTRELAVQRLMERVTPLHRHIANELQ